MGCDKVSIHVINLNEIIKILIQRGIADKPTVKIKWKSQNYSVTSKRRQKKREREQRIRGSIILARIQDSRLRPNHINNYIKSKWFKHLN